MVNAISSGNWGNAWPDDTRFINNLFYVDKGGSAGFDLGGMTKVVFDHNLFWGEFRNRPKDVHAAEIHHAYEAIGTNLGDAEFPR